MLIWNKINPQHTQHANINFHDTRCKMDNKSFAYMPIAHDLIHAANKIWLQARRRRARHLFRFATLLLLPAALTLYARVYPIYRRDHFFRR
jgi:hypothetical protein